LFAAIITGATLCAVAEPPSAQEPHRTLEEVASFPHQEVTGVAVSKTGRIFVNFPNWSDLDPASPKMEGVVNGGPKLVKFDLRNDQLTQKIPFGAEDAPDKSYPNDVRVDSKTNHAYLTDSGLDALLVVDLKTGKTRRLLENRACTKGEPDVHLVVEGSKLVDPKTGESPQMNADCIAFDRETGYLYFHALTVRTLYRISSVYLLDETFPSSSSEIASKSSARRSHRMGCSPEQTAVFTSLLLRTMALPAGTPKPKNSKRSSRTNVCNGPTV
jgi:hypothetical protein